MAEGSEVVVVVIGEKKLKEKDVNAVHPSDVMVPTYEVFELRHILTLPEEIVSADQKAKARADLMEAVAKDSLAPFYRKCCDVLGWTADELMIAEWERRNQESLGACEKELENAKEQYGDVEIKDARLAIAHHFSRIGDWSNALPTYEEVLQEKAIESGGKVDIFLGQARIGLFENDRQLARENIARAEKQLELGGDWERRNRLKIYKAIHLAANERQFAEAAELLLSGLSTFTSTELLAFEHFVRITVLLAMCALPRPTIKQKVANSPEVLQVFAEDSTLKNFFQSFIACNYRVFYENYTEACNIIRRDRFLKQHYRYFVRQMRLVGYRQYLEPFKSVTIPAMAHAFGVSEKFIEEEIVLFISCGQLHCKIDRLAGTIESDVSDVRNTLYADVVKSGDALINRIQMFSRVIDL